MFRSFRPFIKSTLNFGECLFSLWGLYLTILNIRDLWRKEAKENYSFYQRVGLTIFNITHILAMFLAAGLLGELLLSAPLATLLISTTSLISDCYDYVQEMYQKYALQKEYEMWEKRGQSENSNFQQSLLFFEEYFELQNQIEALGAQRQDLQDFLSQVNKTTIQNPHHAKDLEGITESLTTRYQSVIWENEIISKIYDGYGTKVSPEEVINVSHQEIQQINQQKQHLHHELKMLDERDPKDAALAKSYRQLLLKLDSNIKNLAVINHHFYMISKSRITLTELKEQLKNAAQEFQSSEYENESLAAKKALLESKEQYLNKRIQAIEKHLTELQHPELETSESSNSDLQFNAFKALNELNQSPNEVTLKKVLSEQILIIDKMLKVLNKDLTARKKYVENVSESRPTLPAELSQIFDSAKRRIAIKKKLGLTEISEKQKLWSTRYSIITAIIAILLYSSNIWVSSELIEHFMQFIGVMAGLTSLLGYFENKRAKSQHESAEQKEINDIIEECRKRANMVHDPKIRSACFKELGSLTNKLHEQYAANANLASPWEPNSKTHHASPLKLSQGSLKKLITPNQGKVAPNNTNQFRLV